eukprot:1158746-Pelagomonas_calceolata.AAC.8
MPAWKCEVIIITLDLMEETLQCDPPDEATVHVKMTVVFTCESACIYNIIYNTNGKYVGVLNIKRVQTLLEAYEAVKKRGKQVTVQPPVQDTATEIMGLISCQMVQQKQLSAQGIKAHNSNALITPPHIRSALHKWCMVSTEKEKLRRRYSPRALIKGKGSFWVQTL